VLIGTPRERPVLPWNRFGPSVLHPASGAELVARVRGIVIDGRAGWAEGFSGSMTVGWQLSQQRPVV
jgi:hypothetical protein